MPLSAREPVPETPPASSPGLAHAEPKLGIFLAPPLSPSLEGRSGLAAYEFKFLLSEQQAQEVQERLRSHLSVDQHADPRDLSYRISTIYCDTPALDVLHRHGRHRLGKYRVRRYGSSPKIYLEWKAKRGRRVRKRRSTIDLTTLAELNGQEFASLGPAADYRRRLQRSGVAPVCLIEYSRVAFFSSSTEGPLRLTFDRAISGKLQNSWSFGGTSPAQFVLEGKVVCEFKFRGAMPQIFRSVIHDMQLLPGGISKYRHCMHALGLPLPPSEGTAHA